MTTKLFLHIVIALGLLILTTSSYSQRSRTPFQQMMDSLYIETIIIPVDSVDIVNMFVHIRVSKEFFVFVRTTGISGDSAFHAGIQVSIDIFDEKGDLIKSKNVNREVFLSDEGYNEKKYDDVLIREKFEMSTGHFRCVVQLSDEESQREVSNTKMVHVKDFAKLNPIIAAVFPIEQPKQIGQSGGIIHALGLGGNIAFSKTPFFAMYYQGDWATEFKATLSRWIKEDQFATPFTLIPTIHKILPSSILQPDTLSDAFQYNVRKSINHFDNIVFFSLPLDTLEIGMYEMKIIIEQNERRDTLKQNLGIIWRDMPVSLRSLRDAIDAMRYILTEEEYDSMISGSEEERREKFNAFWKKKDQTSKTVRNEYLVEYFSRVDEANIKYQSVRGPDGAFTDRGRIHILYGPSEKTERVLLTNDAPTEIWYYPSIKKKFVFSDSFRNGMYRLTEESSM